MKRKNKFLTIRLNDKMAAKVAAMREKEYGLVTSVVTKAIDGYKLDQDS